MCYLYFMPTMLFLTFWGHALVGVGGGLTTCGQLLLVNFQRMAQAYDTTPPPTSEMH